MGTLKDFFSKNVVGDGAMGDMVRAGQKKASAALEWVGNGMRSGAAKIAGSPVGQPAADIAEGVGNQARAAGQAAVDATASGLRQTAAQVNPGAAEYRSWGPTPDERALSAEYGPELTPTEPAPAAPTAQTKFGPQGSPEAQAFRASGGGAAGEAQVVDGTVAKAAPAAGKVGLLRGAARVAGPVAGALAVGDAALKTSEGDTPEQRAGLSGTQGFATELYDTAALGQGRKFAHGVKRALGAIPGLRTAADAGIPAGDGVGPAAPYASGLRGVAQRFGQGWSEGAALESGGGATPVKTSSDPAAAVAAPAQSEVAAAPGAAQGSQSGNGLRSGTGSLERTTGTSTDVMDPRTGAMTPNSNSIQAAIDFNRRTFGIEPSPEAQAKADAERAGGQNGLRSGSFKVGSQRAIQLGSDAPSPQAQPTGTKVPTAEDEAKKSGVRSDAYYEDLAKRKGDRWASAQRKSDIEREGHMATAALAKSRQDYEIGKDNSEKVNKATEDHIRANAPAYTPTMNPLKDKSVDQKAYDENVKAETAALKDRINHTLGDRSEGTRTIEKLSGTEHRQLLVADKIRKQYEANKDNTVGWMRDFFGTNRFKSDNLDSYMPAKAERKADGIYVTMGNGNKMRLPYLQGGGFQPFGPNDVVDSDIKAVMKGKIDQLLAQEDKERKGAK